MTGLIEELLKNKEEILVNFLKILEGKEAKARVRLDGVELKAGKTALRLDGEIEFTFVPTKKKSEEEEE